MKCLCDRYHLYLNVVNEIIYIYRGSPCILPLDSDRRQKANVNMYHVTRFPLDPAFAVSHLSGKKPHFWPNPCWTVFRLVSMAKKSNSKGIIFGWIDVIKQLFLFSSRMRSCKPEIWTFGLKIWTISIFFLSLSCFLLCLSFYRQFCCPLYVDVKELNNRFLLFISLVCTQN